MMRNVNKSLLYDNVMRSINSDIELSNIAGAAVIVAQHGEIILDERVGYKDIRTKEALSRGTIFRLASMTKPVTGFAFLLGIERGWFKYDDRLADHFPEFAEMMVGRIENGAVIPDHKPKNDILLYQLLSHSSGFMCNSPITEIQKAALPHSVYKNAKTKIDACLKDCLAFEPGEGYGYAQSAPYDVVALLIEKYSGMSYADFLDEYLFKPLGIKDVTYRPTEEQWSRFITMHDRTANAGMVTVDMGRSIFEGNPLEYTAAGAGLCGSIEDYFKFADMLRRGGEYDGGRLVSPETFALYAKPCVDMKYMGVGAQNSWGLGVRVTVGHNTLPDGSFGWSGAYGTHFFIDKEHDITAVYMKNNRWHDSHGAGKTGARFEIDVLSSLE